MKEWQKKVDQQAKDNRKLAKQQQEAAKKVEALRKKGKPVPPELEKIAAGAAIDAAHKASRNNITAVRGRNQGVTDESVDGVDSFDGSEEGTVYMVEWLIHLLICLIPIYNLIYLIKIVTGSRNVKPSLKEFSKLQLIVICATLVILIAVYLIMSIVSSNMW